MPPARPVHYTCAAMRYIGDVAYTKFDFAFFRSIESMRVQNPIQVHFGTNSSVERQGACDHWMNKGGI